MRGHDSKHTTLSADAQDINTMGKARGEIMIERGGMCGDPVDQLGDPGHATVIKSGVGGPDGGTANGQWMDVNGASGHVRPLGTAAAGIPDDGVGVSSGVGGEGGEKGELAFVGLGEGDDVDAECTERGEVDGAVLGSAEDMGGDGAEGGGAEGLGVALFVDDLGEGAVEDGAGEGVGLGV